MLARCIRSKFDDITTFNGNSHTIKWQCVGVQQSQWFSSYTFFKHTKPRAKYLKHREITNISFFLDRSISRNSRIVPSFLKRSGMILEFP
jgi:hypothetical protein